MGCTSCIPCAVVFSESTVRVRADYEKFQQLHACGKVPNLLTAILCISYGTHVLFIPHANKREYFTFIETDYSLLVISYWHL